MSDATGAMPETQEVNEVEETQDTSTMDENVESIEEGNDQDKAASQPAQAKKWAGRFESAEELEQEFFRKSQEYNLLEKELKSKTSQPEQPAKEVSSEDIAWQNIYLETHRNAQKKYGDFFEDDKIQEMAIDEALIKFELWKTKEQISSFDKIVEQKLQYMSSPDYQIEQNVIRSFPEMQQYMSNPESKKAVLQMIKNLQNTQPQMPNVQPQQGYVPNKTQAGNTMKLGSSITPNVSNDAVLVEKIKSWGITSPEGIKAALKTFKQGEKKNV